MQTIAKKPETKTAPSQPAKGKPPDIASASVPDTLAVLCFARIKTAFEMNNIQRCDVTLSYERRCQVKKRPRGRTPHIFLAIQP
jgi:hypothetical protein